MWNVWSIICHPNRYSYGLNGDCCSGTKKANILQMIGWYTHNCCLKNTVDKNKYFVNSVIPAFTKAQANEDVAIIILPWFYEVKKKVALVERPYCLNFDAFADDTCDVKIKWLTKKIKTLFKVTLCTKPVKFKKMLAHVMIVILGNC